MKGGTPPSGRRCTIIALTLTLVLLVIIFRLFLVGEVALFFVGNLEDCDEVTVEDDDLGEPRLVSKAPPLSPWAAKNGVIDRVDVPKDVELYGGKIGKKCTRPRDVIVRWDCQHCYPKDDTSDPNNEENLNCGPLEGKGFCKPLKTWEWDQPWPRSSSLHNPAIFHTPLSWQLTYFDPSITYEMAHCVGAEQPCFDIHRCSKKEDAPLKVYPYSTLQKTSTASFLVEYAAKNFPNVVEKVDHPEDACLLIITPDSFENYKQMVRSQEWNGGQNHVIWRSEKFFGTGARRPFGIWNFELASMVSPLLTEAHARTGYDMVLHQPQKIEVPDNLEDGRDRKYLVAVKGNLNIDTEHTIPTMYHQYVWLAAEYWPSENDDVFVNVQCPDSTELKQPESDVDVLTQSTFAFCTGGVGGPMGGDMSGYFFADAVVAGAIPVITPELTPPFWPEVDWTPCAIIVSEERIVELPGILRQKFSNPEDVQKRREECRARAATIIGLENGKADDYKAAFATAMKVWKHRIHVAHVSEEMRMALNADIDLE